MTGTLILLLSLLFPQVQETLTVRFIGNEAFQITDGTSTVLTDYPYRPGAFGYMTYDPEWIQTDGNVLLLLTHRHLDHFDETIRRKKDWTVAGPREITAKLKDQMILPLDSLMMFGNITIQPIRTDHAGVEHYSYRVGWGEFQLYFVGDTEDPTALLAQTGLDLVFVTPWLWAAVKASGATIDAGEVVIYHHREGQNIFECGSCWIPTQGETRTFGGS